MGRIRYQKPGVLWPPPEPMGREEACEWLAKQYEELQSKIEEARKHHSELGGELVTARWEKRTACAGGKKTYECQEATRRLRELYDEQEEIKGEAGKWQAECIVIEARMKKLKCEEG